MLDLFHKGVRFLNRNLKEVVGAFHFLAIYLYLVREHSDRSGAPVKNEWAAYRRDALVCLRRETFGNYSHCSIGES